MGFAAFDWARRAGVPVVYRERRHGFLRLSFEGSVLRSESLPCDPDFLNALDPSETVRCQLEAGDVERAGELMVLNEKGRRTGRKELGKWLANGRECAHLLEVIGEGDPERKQGDALELQTAAVLLHLGVPMVCRSLRLKASESDGVMNSEPFQEVDLLFHHRGRLWLVDCKDPPGGRRVARYRIQGTDGGTCPARAPWAGWMQRFYVYGAPASPAARNCSPTTTASPMCRGKI